MTCDVNSGVAIKKIVINDAVGRDAAVLSPNMQAIVMIGVGSRVPLHIIMDVVVMYRKTRGGSLRTESKPVINVVDVGIRQGEVVSVPCEGPPRIMSRHVSTRKTATIDSKNAIYARLP